MKTTLRSLLFIATILTTLSAKAQFVSCESMPIYYDPASPVFSTSSGPGDSMLVFSMTNTSSTNFAYPQAKIIPVTPLPSGTTLTDNTWHVFFSSWNTGVTGYPQFFFNVSAPIPPDYTCKFIVMCTNFSPLSIDSCAFTDTMTVNLNPTATSVRETAKENTVFDIYPNPASESIHIITNVATPQIALYDLNGRLLHTFIHASVIDIHQLPKGVYCLKCTNTGQTQRLVKQ